MKRVAFGEPVHTILRTCLGTWKLEDIQDNSIRVEGDILHHVSGLKNENGVIYDVKSSLDPGVADGRL